MVLVEAAEVVAMAGPDPLLMLKLLLLAALWLLPLLVLLLWLSWQHQLQTPLFVPIGLP